MCVCVCVCVGGGGVSVQHGGVACGCCMRRASAPLCQRAPPTCPADTGALYPSSTMVRVGFWGPSGVSRMLTFISRVARPWGAGSGAGMCIGAVHGSLDGRLLVRPSPLAQRLHRRATAAPGSAGPGARTLSRGLSAYSLGTSKVRPATMASSTAPTYSSTSRCLMGTAWGSGQGVSGVRAAWGQSCHTHTHPISHTPLV